MTCQGFIPIPKRSVLHSRDQNTFVGGVSYLREKEQEGSFHFFERMSSISSEDKYLMKISKSVHSCNEPNEFNVGGLSPSPVHDPSWWGDENGSCDNGILELPEDFIPPRHLFVHAKGSIDPKPPKPVEQVQEELPEGFVHLRDKDIVCGRGAPTMLHPGNQAYRALIQKHETDYLWAKRSDKPVIAMQIMEALKREDVRFVRKEGNSRGWVILEESKIYEKVCQSLREGAPELRRKILASDVRKKVEQSHAWTAARRGSDQENNTPAS